jgi:hypothetical protein
MNTIDNSQRLTNLGKQLQTNRWAKILELLLFFLVAPAFIQIMTPFAVGNQVWMQDIVWTANVMMLILVWAGLQLRGETWKDFGLSFSFISW